jgi:anaerobic magnesium-protoporphyrin IX monomethyl ester cyclase
MAKVLLINPSYRDSYGSAKAAIIDPVFPTLSLLTTAAMAERGGHKVEILDLSYLQYDYRRVQEAIQRAKPDVVGVTATTPLMNQVRDISVLVKAVSQSILTVAGGAHVSALPSESLLESMLDVAVVGEGDQTFAELMDGHPLNSISGIYYRGTNGEIQRNVPRPFIQNLDDLPMPAWHLYNSDNYKYRISRLLAKRPPLAMAEFSRGCVFKCDFCASKNTMALGYRKKSPERCAEEVKVMHRHGYREFALADDIFTSDETWAKAVGAAIIRTGIDMAWSCTNGIRVESADDELFTTMRRAGCYRVAFGFESGNDRVLKSFGKGGRASIEKGHAAVRMARKAGIDTVGYFMLGLSPDTEESMADTIEYARSLPLDMMKFGVAIAFPGTEMFKNYREHGLIRSYNWDEYFIYTEKALFAHPNFDFEAVKQFAATAYRRAVLTNPAFILRRLLRGVRTGEFFWDVYYFFRFIFSPPINASTRASAYYAKDKWPVYDFERNNITYYPPRPAGNKITEEMVHGVRI